MVHSNFGLTLLLLRPPSHSRGVVELWHTTTPPPYSRFIPTLRQSDPGREYKCNRTRPRSSENLLERLWKTLWVFWWQRRWIHKSSLLESHCPFLTHGIYASPERLPPTLSLRHSFSLPAMSEIPRPSARKPTSDAREFGIFKSISEIRSLALK